MTKIYRVSDDGQLIERITTEEVQELAREQLSNAPRNAEISLEEAKRVIAGVDSVECQHVCFSFVEAMSLAKYIREMRTARGF